MLYNLSSSLISPAARCSCCLDGVDPETGRDVPERLHSLLVRFVVVLHLVDAPKKKPTHAHTSWLNKREELKNSRSAVLREVVVAQRAMAGVKKRQRRAAGEGRGEGGRVEACLQAKPKNTANLELRGTGSNSGTSTANSDTRDTCMRSVTLIRGAHFVE